MFPLKFVLFFLLSSMSLIGLAMTVEEAEVRLDEQMEIIRKSRMEQMRELRKMYLQALLRYESAATRQGDLDALQAARQEINRVESEPNLRAAPESGTDELRSLASVVNAKLETFHQESAQKIAAMVESVSEYADSQATTLTRQGSIQEAIAWRDFGRGLKERPRIANALSGLEDSGDSATSSDVASENIPKLFNRNTSSVVDTKATGIPAKPTVYMAGSEPDMDEKRITSSTPSAQGAGNSLLQARIKLIEEDNVLNERSGYGSDYEHKAFLYAARLEITPLPGRSLDRSLVVFDLFKRGTGSKRGVIRTEGLILPPLSAGTRWVIDSGSYEYETQEYDSRWSTYDYESSTADEFYGFVVSIFDEKGTLLLQRTSERKLSEYARTSVPDSFDHP